MPQKHKNTKFHKTNKPTEKNFSGILSFCALVAKKEKSNCNRLKSLASKIMKTKIY